MMNSQVYIYIWIHQVEYTNFVQLFGCETKKKTSFHSKTKKHTQILVYLCK